MRAAATILNQIDTEMADEILEGVGDDESDLAGEIRRAMFTFEDLLSLDQRGFQVLLKEIPSDQLLIALKTASEELKEKLFGSLSKRAGAMLMDDLEVMGPVRLADVEESQQTIVSAALQLQAEGKLSIAGHGGDDYV